MCRFLQCLLFCALCGSLGAIDIIDNPDLIQRGDANNDYVVNVSDTSFLSDFLFHGGPEPPCLNQADANDDGLVDVSDNVFLSQWLFNGGPPPPYPGPFSTECVEDPTEPNLDCEVLACP